MSPLVLQFVLAALQAAPQLYVLGQALVNDLALSTDDQATLDAALQSAETAANAAIVQAEADLNVAAKT